MKYESFSLTRSILDENLNQLSLLTEEIDNSSFESFKETVKTIDELLEWFDVNITVGFETDEKVKIIGEPNDSLKNFNEFITKYKMINPSKFYISKTGLSFDWTLFIADMLQNSTIYTENDKPQKIFTILSSAEHQGILYSTIAYLDNTDRYCYIEPFGEFKGVRDKFNDPNELMHDISQTFSRSYDIPINKVISNLFPIDVLYPNMMVKDLMKLTRFRYDIFIEKLLKDKENDN